MAASKEERFDEFVRRLALAPAAESTAQALVLLSRVLNEVEDEMSTFPIRHRTGRQMDACIRRKWTVPEMFRDAAI